MDSESIVVAVAATSLALNGYFLRVAAKDLKGLGARTTQLEKNEAVQEWRLDNLEEGQG
ncbi:MAG: hypothetical protein GY906_38625 [bacterium]|nr:hypothetical protein [bacterium]